MPPFATGAHESHFDSRTRRHDTTLATGQPLTTGGVHYEKIDIDHQHHEGICTAIHLTQNANKALGKRYSPDFQYLLQKKYFDLAWFEGSSIFNALRAAKKYGFLPIEHFSYVTEMDRNLPYSDYIKKLQAIPDSEITRLLTLCEKTLTGYASVTTDPMAMAKAILDSKSGILTRYTVGEEWWTAQDGRVSWDKRDIDPLRPPKNETSGHAITQSYFDFTLNQVFELPNTWGATWNDNGVGHTIYSNYHCTEAWIPYYDIVPVPLPPKFIFTTDMKYGETSEDVKQLQKRLGVIETGFYGNLTKQAVLNYQIANIPLSLYERYFLKGSICGTKTRTKLNNS